MKTPTPVTDELDDVTASDHRDTPTGGRVLSMRALQVVQRLARLSHEAASLSRWATSFMSELLEGRAMWGDRERMDREAELRRRLEIFELLMSSPFPK